MTPRRFPGQSPGRVRQPDDPGPDPDDMRPFDYRDDGRARRTIAGLLIAGLALAAGIIALALS